jgi:hypothetical protein
MPALRPPRSRSSPVRVLISTHVDTARAPHWVSIAEGPAGAQVRLRCSSAQEAARCSRRAAGAGPSVPACGTGDDGGKGTGGGCGRGRGERRPRRAAAAGAPGHRGSPSSWLRSLRSAPRGLESGCAPGGRWGGRVKAPPERARRGSLRGSQPRRGQAPPGPGARQSLARRLGRRRFPAGDPLEAHAPSRRRPAAALGAGASNPPSVLGAGPGTQDRLKTVRREPPPRSPRAEHPDQGLPSSPGCPARRLRYNSRVGAAGAAPAMRSRSGTWRRWSVRERGGPQKARRR